MHLHRSKTLDSIDGIVHGFSDREIGADLSQIEKSADLPRIAQLNQVHSARVIVLDDIDDHDDQTQGDSMITNIKGIGIGIRTADCVPILMTDRSGSVIAAVHAGWRGTVSGIAQNTVNTIVRKYGINPSEIIAAIGPSISNCCYEIGEDVASLFREAFSNSDQYLFESSDSKYLLDLSTANRLSLEHMGVMDIEVLDICTKCNQNFYSYRREGKGVNTQLSYIALSN